MKLKSILDTLATVAGIANPAVGMAIKAVNQFLPDEKKLPETATGNDVATVLKTLPPDMQLKLLETDLQVELAEITAWTEINKAHAEADASGSSTRPAIAMMMAWCVVAQVAAVVLSIIGASCGYPSALTALKTNWEMLTVSISTPTALLWAYFGLRTDEKKARYAVSTGQPIPEKKGILAGLLK